MIVLLLGWILEGVICDEFIIIYDFFLMFVEFVDVLLFIVQLFDGVSLVELFENLDFCLFCDVIYWYYLYYYYDCFVSCICVWDWKLIEYFDESGDIEFFYIVNDIGEIINFVEVNLGCMN